MNPFNQMVGNSWQKVKDQLDAVLKQHDDLHQGRVEIAEHRGYTPDAMDDLADGQEKLKKILKRLERTEKYVVQVRDVAARAAGDQANDDMNEDDEDSNVIAERATAVVQHLVDNSLDMVALMKLISSDVPPSLREAIERAAGRQTTPVASQLADSISSPNPRLSKAREDIRELIKQLRTARDDRDEQESLAGERQTALAIQSNEVIHLKQDLRDEKIRHELTETQLRGYKDKALKELGNVIELKANIASLESKLDESKTDANEDVRDRNAELEAQMERLQLELRQSHESLERAQGHWDDQKVTLEHTISNLREDMERAQDSVKSSMDLINKFNAEKELAGQQIQSDKAGAAEDLQHARHEVREAQRESRDERKRSDELQKKLQESDALVASFRHQSEVLAQGERRAQVEARELRGAHEELRRSQQSLHDCQVQNAGLVHANIQKTEAKSKVENELSLTNDLLVRRQRSLELAQDHLGNLRLDGVKMTQDFERRHQDALNAAAIGHQGTLDAAKCKHRQELGAALKELATESEKTHRKLTTEHERVQLELASDLAKAQQHLADANTQAEVLRQTATDAEYAVTTARSVVVDALTTLTTSPVHQSHASLVADALLDSSEWLTGGPAIPSSRLWSITFSPAAQREQRSYSGSLPEMLLEMALHSDVSEQLEVLQGLEAALRRPYVRVRSDLLDIVCDSLRRLWKDGQHFVLKVAVAQILEVITSRFTLEAGAQLAEHINASQDDGDEMVRTICLTGSLEAIRALPPQLYADKAIIVASRSDSLVLVLWHEERVLVCAHRDTVAFNLLTGNGVLSVANRQIQLESARQRTIVGLIFVDRLGR